MLHCNGKLLAVSLEISLAAYIGNKINWPVEAIAYAWWRKKNFECGIYVSSVSVGKNLQKYSLK